VPKPAATTTRALFAEAGTSPSKEDITGGSTKAERNKLVFFEGAVYTFDLEDLLRASAEVLGKGSVGHCRTHIFYLPFCFFCFFFFFSLFSLPSLLSL
jgi:hypothetical protein